jgi:hypothetical protein
MNPPKNKAPCRASGDGARDYQTTHSVARITPSEAHAQAACKAVAVMLYCIGARSLRETQSAFAQHPQWVAS